MNHSRTASHFKLLIVYLLFCVFVLTSVAASLNRLIKRSTSAQINNILSLMSEKVDTAFGMMVDYVTEAADIISADETCNFDAYYDQLQQTLDTMPYSSIGLIDSEGNIYGTNGEKLDIEKQELIEKAELADSIYISEPYRSSVTGTNMITMIAPLERGGQKIGSLYANYYLETIQNLASTNILSENTFVFLMNPFSGNYVSCSANGSVPAGTWSNIRLIKSDIKGLNDYDYDVWLKNMRENAEPNLVNYTLKKATYTEAYVGIDGMKNWFIVIQIPLAELSGTMHQYAWGVGICAALLIFATLLLAGHLYNSERRENVTLQDLSEHDPLTGLYNRRAFDAHMQDIFKEIPQGDISTFMFFDIDKFKSVNDNYGHDAGDQVLCFVADALAEAFDGTGIAARIGGDEFNVFIYAPLTVANLDDILANLRRNLKNFKLEDGTTLPISFCAGLAVYPQDAHDLKFLTKCADEALYHAKEAGRNDHHWYHDIS
ncbi:MAG: GGDEF domain-containing protein [Firmicutes bacterium]|nr:GGDEF domain-containing protein [Bacillota bacterium]